MTDKLSEAQMDPKQKDCVSSPSILDHLLVKEDVCPNDEEQFASDPDTIPYHTAALLGEEKANDHFCKPPQNKKMSEGKQVENKHQECYQLAWTKIKELTKTEVKLGKSN